MSQQESAAVRNANKHFRKEQQKKVGAAAVWQEYSDLEQATRLKTARLRAERLARDAAAKVAPCLTETVLQDARRRVAVRSGAALLSSLKRRMDTDAARA